MSRKQVSDNPKVQKDRDRALQYYYDHRQQILERQKAKYQENKANRDKIAELEAEIERLRGALDGK